MDENKKIDFSAINDADAPPMPEVDVELAKSSAAFATRSRRDESTEPEGQLTIDVYQTPSEIVIESAIAGVGEGDLDIQVSADSVTIKGSRRREKSVKDDDYLYQECYWGRFSRSIILPQEVDAEGAQASLKNGILTVRLPKLSKVRAKRLKVHLE